MQLNPKLVFVNGDISITDGDGSTAYIFEVTGYADGEYESYIGLFLYANKTLPLWNREITII